MPQQSHNSMKGTSPSKLIQQGVDKSWGQQQKGSTDPKQVLNQAWNKHPVTVPKSGKK